MIEIRYKTRRGHPSHVRKALRQVVESYTRKHSVFKIGRTSTPEARAAQPDYADEYDRMIVIYETMTADHADAVERDLIDYFQESENFRGGGGGPRGKPPYYVYLVRRKSLLDEILSIFD